MSELVDWAAAARVAGGLAGRRPPLAGYEQRTLESDLIELTTVAEELVSAETGLTSLAGPARARVTDRVEWVHANVASFQRLLRPVTIKLEASLDRSKSRMRFPPVVSRRIAGTQMGLLLGWMSTRVLGQYDQLLIEDEDPEDQDIVYFVGPNIVALERRFGFPPREFRLWLALHEVTHRAQFTGVPWMRAHFLSLVNRTLDGIDPDPRHLLDALKRSAAELKGGRSPLDEGGLITLLAGPEQYQAIQEIGGLMSLLEGHGDTTMNRAATDRIPNAARFHRILHERRQQHGLTKVMMSLLGLEAKMRQYEQGERFIEAVEETGGGELLSRVWTAPEWLPSGSEIRDPGRWIDRARATPLALG